MMNKKIVLGFLVLTLLSCNYVTQMIVPPTATPLPTATTIPTETVVPSPTAVQLQPAFIPDECASTPLATVEPGIQAQATQEAGTNPDVSKDEQLRILKDLSDVVTEVYVYPDYNGKDWNEIQTRYQGKIEAGLDTEAFYTEMQNMIGELGDDHSFFLSPLAVQESEDELKGDVQFVGVGVYANFDYEHNRVIVISTFPDSAAEHAGIKAHDTLLTADGLPILDDQQNNRLRGPECSAVLVSVQTPGGEPRDVLLVRHEIEGNLRIEAHLGSDHRWIEDRLYLHPHIFR